jgi:hypothetical protein
VVKGLHVFRDFFAPYNNQYIVIGATACTVAMEANEIDYRITKDIDIVLVVEALTAEFVKAFWKFIDLGGYQKRMKSDGTPQFFRFDKPSDALYPDMLELFSRKPDSLVYEGSGHLIPIPVSDDLSSLSAILLDNAYYTLILEGRQDLQGLSYLKPEYIVILKAKAWLDLTARKEKNQQVDSRDIAKHRNDILRLFQVIEPATKVALPDKVRADMVAFLNQLESESINLNDLSINNITLKNIVDIYRSIYSINR